MTLASYILQAHSVACAFARLANDAIDHEYLPTSVAETLSRDAKEAAAGLTEVLVIKAEGDLVPSQVKALKTASIDLEALGELASLVSQYGFTPKTLSPLALTLRYTAERTADVLSRVMAELKT